MDLFKRLSNDLRNKPPREITRIIIIAILVGLSHDAVFHWAVEEIANLFGWSHPSALKIASFVWDYAVLFITIGIAMFAVHYGNYLPLFMLYIAMITSFNTLHLMADLQQVDQRMTALTTLRDLEEAKAEIETRLLHYDELFQYGPNGPISISSAQLNFLAEAADSIEKEVKFIADTRSLVAARVADAGLDGQTSQFAITDYKLINRAGARQEYRRLYERYSAARPIIRAVLKAVQEEILRSSTATTPGTTAASSGPEDKRLDAK